MDKEKINEILNDADFNSIGLSEVKCMKYYSQLSKLFDLGVKLERERTHNPKIGKEIYRVRNYLSEKYTENRVGL